MRTSKFDIADYLDSNEMVAAYLNEILEDGTDEDVVVAIGRIDKCIGKPILVVLQKMNFSFK